MPFDRPVGARPGAPPTAYLDTDESSVGSNLAGGLRTLPFGSGKAAMAHAIRSLDPPPGATVLLPAAVPHRFPEAIRAAGATPRYYRVDDGLEPDLDDLQARVGDETVALVGVHYFGFAQSAFEALRDVADDEGLLLVDDSSHGALSERGGRPFGSFGDVGFTSLHKLLPIPDGALLYSGGDDRFTSDLPARSTPSAVEESRYVAAAAARWIAETIPHVGPASDVGRGASSTLQTLADLADPTPYSDWDRGMSRTTRAFLETVDRERIVARRRARYREWLDVLGGVEGVVPLFETLPDGVCPWVCPVVCSDPMRFLRTVGRRVGGTFRWPKLPDTVDARSYPTADRLSRTLVALPVHHGIRRGHIRALVSARDGSENRS